jgi:hypothetical protein
MAPLGRNEFIAQQREKRRQLAAGMTQAQIDASNNARVEARAAKQRRRVAEWVAATEHHRAPAPLPRLDETLAARARNAPRRGTSRESRPSARRARSASTSRDGPLPPDDDPDLTPLQRGFLLLLEALCTASADGLRTFLTFLEMAAARVAAEIARVDDWSER